MSVVMNANAVGAMARWCAIAAVLAMVLAGCRSSRDVAQRVESHKILREIDTLVTVPGGTAQMVADVSVCDGALMIGGVETTGAGVQLRARVEAGDSGAYRLVVDAAVPERAVAVQLHEERTDVEERSQERSSHDSRVLPVWVVVAVVAIVMIIINVLRRWKKK